MLAALHSNQFVTAVCIWTKVITIRDEGLHLYPGSELKLQKKGGKQMGEQERKQRRERMDGVTEMIGGDLNVQRLPSYNAPGKLVYAWISYVT